MPTVCPGSVTVKETERCSAFPHGCTLESPINTHNQMMGWVRGCYSKAFRGDTTQLRCSRCALKCCSTLFPRKIIFLTDFLICLIDLKREKAFSLQAARSKYLPSLKCPLPQKQDSALQQICCHPGSVPAGKQGAGKRWETASQSKAKKTSRSHTPCVLLSLKPFAILLTRRAAQCYPSSH